jgi:hypothetical protein
MNSPLEPREVRLRGLQGRDLRVRLALSREPESGHAARDDYKDRAGSGIGIDQDGDRRMIGIPILILPIPILLMTTFSR